MTSLEIQDNNEIPSSKKERKAQIENKIYENESNYYLSRLQKRISRLHKSLVYLLLILMIDLLAIYFYPKLFLLKSYFIIIAIELLWCLICIILFCNSYKNANEVNLSTFRKVKFCLYFTLFLAIINIINCLSLIIFKIALNFPYWSELINKNFNFSLIIYISGLFTYFGLNIILPFFVYKRFGKVRKTLKSFGTAIGQDFSITYTVSVPDKSFGLEGGERKVEMQ